LGNENVEEIWYALWLIKAIVAIVTLCFFGAVALICKRLLCRIPGDRVKRSSVKHTMMQSFGTLQPPRNFDASESKTIDLRGDERKRNNG
jgi:hypothetical protein